MEARNILSKKAYKVLATVKRLFSNSDTTTIIIKNKLFDALVKPILLYECEIWGRSYYHIGPILTKVLLNKSISSSVNKHQIPHGTQRTLPVGQSLDGTL